MDLKLAITVVALAASVYSVPVPPNGPKYVPVFVSSDALNNLNEKEGQNIPSESGEPTSPQGPNSDFDIKKEIQHIFNTPAPVYEQQPEQYNPSYLPPQYQTQQPQPNYQNQQPGQILPQYQNNQQLAPQPYQVNQQPLQPPYQINQQPNQMQQYQVSQPGQPQLFQLNQQGQLQQPIYGNQQQQPLWQQSGQQPMFNQQQLVPQQVPTYQQPNQLLLAQPAGNQQILTQPTQPILLNQQTPIAPLPNQQIFLQQPNSIGQPMATNINPVNLGQPSNQVSPGYIPNQNQNVFAMVPLNQSLTPNQNIGTNTYLVPVQQLPNTPNQIYAVNSG